MPSYVSNTTRVEFKHDASLIMYHMVGCIDLDFNYEMFHGYMLQYYSHAPELIPTNAQYLEAMRLHASLGN